MYHNSAINVSPCSILEMPAKVTGNHSDCDWSIYIIDGDLNNGGTNLPAKSWLT